MNEKIPPVPRPKARASFRTSSSGRDIATGKCLSIAIVWECIATTFCSIWQIPQIHRFLYDVPNNWSTTILYILTSHAHVRSCPIHMCRGMSICTRTACLMAILNCGVSTNWTYEYEFCWKNELLTNFRLRPCPLSSPQWVVF